MAMKKLRNMLRRTRVFNLEHPYFLSQQGENGAGKPETLTLLPREVKDVPSQALECQEIKACLSPKDGRRPTLRVIG